MPRRRLAIVLVVLAALLPAPAPARAAAVTVSITSGLDPATLTVQPGTAVTWRNDDAARHRVRSTSGPEPFDSGDLDPGATFSVTFSVFGTTAYRDDRNRDVAAYWGTVTVADAPAPTASAGSSLPPGGTPPPTTVTIHLAGRAFTPSTIVVDGGTTVTWLNDDSRDHTATSGAGSWDSGRLAPGSSYRRTFTTPGTFAYLCLLHPDMTGTVAVRGAGGATPPPPPPATAVPTVAPVPTLAPGATVPPPTAARASIADFRFVPAELRVTAGSTITWRNDGLAPHTVTAPDGSFDSGLLGPGATFTRRFASPGTYAVLCSVHPTMTGRVLVDAVGATTIPAPSGDSGSPDPSPVGTGAAGPHATDAPGASDPGGGAMAPPAGDGSGTGTSQAGDDAVVRSLLAAILIAAALTLFALGITAVRREPADSASTAT